MCKIGDIIVVKDPKINGKPIGQHSFVVLSTDEGEIEGMPYDLVTNIMSSFSGKSEDYKKKKLSYPENMPYEPSEENIIDGHGKDGFIKAGLYFLFERDKTDFYVLGNIETELYIRLINYINHMDSKLIQYVTDNL